MVEAEDSSRGANPKEAMRTGRSVTLQVFGIGTRFRYAVVVFLLNA